MTYQKSIVAFLDILGTKDNQSFESKHKVHRVFHESMKEFQARDRLEADYYRKAFSFSDCAYIFHGFREGVDDSHHAENLLIQAALFNTTLTTIRLLNEGYLIRGGIAYGDAYHDDLSFFGPAVEDAYILESKKAVTPRILISESLGERAKIFSDNAHQKELSEKNPNFKLLPKRSYIPELIQKNGAAYYLNPFYIIEMECQLKIGQYNFSHDELTKSVIANIEAQIHHYPWESPVRPKLEWMREYAINSKCSLEQPNSSFAFSR
ncbi:hypothetical protein [Azonexus sp.]|jgi:hypothetical protein|uniref:hypothetical protein n=1 Tax=Azonexus sp. TaxID=1872668 RepID=UPI0028194952|nr:hypothetical protein [Azonexus sp.]MDR1994263.1 hypothetical protein [Azonexus sp.]